MRAVQINGYGGSEVMILNDAVVAPVAAAGQVLVAVHAASVNPFDVKVRDGEVRSMQELAFPAILGGDVSGVVAATGEGVTGFAIGDEVYGMANALSSHGSFAEFVTVSAEQLAHKPANASFEEAAALPLVAASAYQALVTTMQLHAGQKILIHGGSGGIGSVAIQIAKHCGATVVTTASAANADFVRKLGADEVIDYATQDFSEVVRECDAVFDTVGGETYDKSFAVLKPGGTLVSMVSAANNELAEKYHVEAVQQFTQATSESLSKIAALFDDGHIATSIDQTFSLDQLAAAFEHLKSGHPRGKVVITVSEH